MNYRGIVNEFIVKYFPKAGKVTYALGIMLRKIRMPECKKEYGNKNPDKTFFVIRQYSPGQGGVLCNYIYIIKMIDYSIKKGWIPVVDMENYKVLYSQDYPVNSTQNAWEYFFEQPDKVDLHEVYQSKNVILSSAIINLDDFHSLNLSELFKRYSIASKVPLNSFVMEFIYNHSSDILEKVKRNRVLGVYYRGTTYKMLKDHPSPIDEIEYFDMIKHEMISQNGRYIFIISDEWECVEKMKKTFPNVLCVEHPRIKGFDAKKNKSIREQLPDGSKDEIENLLYYLEDVYIFSKCTSIIGSMNNGLYTSIIWNNGKYENIKII